MSGFKRIADAADFIILRILPVICGTMLVLMVGFIAYTIVMRTVFLNPPFWGDTLALFANVWMVFLGLIIAVRERSNIAMEALYQMIPAQYGRWFRKLWAVAFAGFGLLLLTMAFTACGLFISSLTREPTIAAVGSFAALLVIWLLKMPASFDSAWAPLFDYLSLISHYQDLITGLFDSADVAYYLLFTALFLWLTVLRLDMERN